MKTLYVILILAGFSLVGCKDELGVDELSSTDQAALLALQEDMNAAALYNDSLANYVDLTGITNDEHCKYFDGHFHYHDSLFTMHHNEYSHSYSWDDHRMGTGGMMMQNSGMMGNAPAGMGHFQGDHEFMDSLMVAHEPYHVDN